MNCLSLFSGIGGLDLAAQWAGMQTVALCESDDYCQRVLAKHWPGVPIYDDVRTLSADRLRADGIGPIDLIHGGFPCQDISNAGKCAGISGERSGLWRDYARLVCELRPRYAVVENVAALLGRGLDAVLSDLADCGMDAVWTVLRAADAGAPHLRSRLFILAYAHGIGFEASELLNRAVADAQGAAESKGLFRGVPDRGGSGRVRWVPLTGVGRVVDGLPSGLDRYRVTGNAVVPAQAYPFFAAIARSGG